MSDCSMSVKCATMPPELEYMSEDYVQDAILDVYKEKVPLEEKSDYEKVTINFPESAHYTSMRNTYLVTTCKVTKPSGVDCVESDKVGVVNNLAHSMWKDIQIFVNDKKVEAMDSRYPYRAYFEELLGRQAFALSKRKSLLGWSKDTAGKFDKVNIGEGNEGLDARSTPFALSKEVTLITPIVCDLASESLLLPPNIKIKIDLHRAANAFVLLSSTQTKFELHITSLTLYIERAVVRPELALAHKMMFSKLPENKLQLPARRVKIDVFPMHASSNTARLDGMFSGLLPDRFFVVFIPQTASGDGIADTYSTNPFNFAHYSVRKIQAKINSVGFPREEYECDFSKTNGFIREFYSLLEEFDAQTGNTALDLTEADFRSGYTIFPFRLVPRACNGSLLGLSKTGSVSLEISFAAALGSTVDVLVLSETRQPIILEKIV